MGHNSVSSLMKAEMSHVTDLRTQQPNTDYFVVRSHLYR